MSELWGKIVTGLITAIATLIVCLINNYFASKRDKDTRDQKNREHIEEMQKSYLKEVSNIKTDYSSQVQGLAVNIADVKTSITDMVTKNTHQLDLMKMSIDTLSEKQSAYNNLQARTYANERDIEVLKALTNTKKE